MTGCGPMKGAQGHESQWRIDPCSGLCRSCNNTTIGSKKRHPSVSFCASRPYIVAPTLSCH
jgi:hypothetical protein